MVASPSCSPTTTQHGWHYRVPLGDVLDQLAGILLDGFVGIDALDEYMLRYADSDEEAKEISEMLPDAAALLGVEVSE